MAIDATTTETPLLGRSTNPVLEQVPFVTADWEWKPTRTGDYGKDCDAGRHAAERLMAVIQQTDNPVLFGTVMRSIIAAGKYDAVEIGFCSVIGIELTK